MKNAVKQCLKLVNDIKIEEKNSESQVMAMSLIIVMINCILGEDDHGFSKESQFAQDLLSLMLLVSDKQEKTPLTKEFVNLFKSVAVEFNKAIFPKISEKGAFKIDKRNSLVRVIGFIIRNIEIYMEYIKSNSPKDIIDEAKSIISEMHESAVNNDRNNYFNNEFIPYLRNNADIHSESISIYINEIFKTKTSIKKFSDDYEFFMKGLVAYANATMVDLIRLYDDNKLELTDIIGAFYDLMVLIKAHILNDKKSLIHRNL